MSKDKNAIVPKEDDSNNNSNNETSFFGYSTWEEYKKSCYKIKDESNIKTRSAEEIQIDHLFDFLYEINKKLDKLESKINSICDVLSEVHEDTDDMQWQVGELYDSNF